MASANFVYQDAVDHVRQQLQDAVARRWSDEDIRVRIMPRVLQQLRADRPDAFFGSFGASLDVKPTLAAPCAFDDMVFNAFVEALVAAILAGEEESVAQGAMAAADGMAQRTRST